MKSIKLNLGAGSEHLPGWLNTDIDPATYPDHIVDLTKPLPFPSSSASHIRLFDVLEHFTKQDASKLLFEIHRVLTPTGRLSIRVPHPQEIFRRFRKDPAVMLEFLYGTTDQNGIWGSHKFGYSPITLPAILKLHGFHRIVLTPEITNLLAECQKSTALVPKPNILVIEQAPDWGGAEEWMTTLVKSWRQKGYKVTGITDLPKMQQNWQKLGAKIIPLPFILDIIGNWKGLVKSLILLPYAVYWYTATLIKAKQSGVNCVINSGFSEKLLVSPIAKMLGLPIIWFEYGPLKTVFSRNWYLPKVLYRATKSLPEAVITISQVSKRSLIIDARVSLAKIHLIHPGTKQPASVSAYPKNPIIGHLSRLAPEKGQRLLIRAFARLVKKYPRAKLVIAGSGPDEAVLRFLVAKYRLNRRVTFMGFIPEKDKPAFYRSLSVFAFTSLWPLEGFGLVMAEAMAQGRPVVALDNGPARQVVGKSAGLVVAPNARSLALGLSTVLKHPAKFPPQTIHKYAKEHFQATIQVAQVTQVIKDAIRLYQPS